jgi:hypothetical protein
MSFILDGMNLQCHKMASQASVPALTWLSPATCMRQHMSQANSEVITNTPITAQLVDGLSELEAPLLRVRDLIRCLQMMAASQEEEDERLGLDAFAETVMDRMDALVEERTRLWRLAHHPKDAAATA